MTERSSITRALSAPGKYIQGPGELDRLTEHTEKFGENVFVLIDPYFYESMSEKLKQQYKNSDSFIETEEFGGEISETEIERITELASKKDFDVVLGIGGGKTLDTIKVVGNNIDANIVIIPTAASTDAPTSALSVIYTEEGVKAKLAAEAGVSTTALENVIEANTLLSGLVFESTGVAGAHAIHDAFTILDDCHGLYHGEKVAFGTICQLVLENRSKSEIKEVIEFCQQVELPTTLKDMGITEDVKTKINDVAKEVINSPLIKSEPFEVTLEQVFGAILTADALGKHYKEQKQV